MSVKHKHSQVVSNTHQFDVPPLKSPSSLSDSPYCVRYTLVAGSNSFSNYGCNHLDAGVVTISSLGVTRSVPITSTSYSSKSSTTSVSSELSAAPISTSSSSLPVSTTVFGQSQASASGGVPVVTVTTNGACGRSIAWSQIAVFVFLVSMLLVSSRYQF